MITVTLTKTTYAKVITLSQELELGKLSSKEIYSIQIQSIVSKSTSDIYFEKLFENTTLDWDKIYLPPHLATIDTTLRSFQYKILNTVPFLIKKTIHFWNNKYCSLVFL